MSVPAFRRFWVVFNERDYPVAVFQDESKAEAQARSLSAVPPGLMKYRHAAAAEVEAIAKVLTKTAIAAVEQWATLKTGVEP